MKHSALFITAGLLLAAPAQAEDYVLTLKDHQFTPKELAVPANEKVKIVVRNEDAAAAEFESYDLNREKVVDAKGQIVVFVGPLAPGTYGFFDDFHRDTTKGTLTAK